MTGAATSAPEGSDAASVTALRIIEAMLQGAGTSGVSEIAARLGLPKARVHRHLTQLRTSGYVLHDPKTRRYEIGWRLALLGNRIATQASFVIVAKPRMEQLRDEVNQTIVFSQVNETGVVVMEVLPGNAPMDILFHPGTTFGFNAAAQGKIALAFGSLEQLRTWESLDPEVRTPQTITDRARLDEAVAQARIRGWASAPEETYLGVNAIAAPVRDSKGSLVGTLAIIGSVHYLPDPPAQETIDALLAASARLSADFGFEAPDQTTTNPNENEEP
ncbi:IclR family transcriptional regulator [Homoserinimonas aerilata]|uniref:IclR family transcriptional regulator n=1 Tax=Homoserinimonas aerilata TaxID=1162970 RepID=A0A542YG99_9MICO|nr:IclR family transcriptional regulator [Homoserinimonas aerilata]TQL47105.1 IclR family transcriptional regulator [Homoserinimonas aerilata]